MVFSEYSLKKSSFYNKNKVNKEGRVHLISMLRLEDILLSY